MSQPPLDIARLFADETAAHHALACCRWLNGHITCPLCDSNGKIYEINYAYKGKSEKTSKRKYWKCSACKRRFSSTSRTIFEGVHIPLAKWFHALFLMCSAEGVSPYQLSRELDLEYKTARFMCHRIRLALLQEPLAGAVAPRNSQKKNI